MGDIGVLIGSFRRFGPFGPPYEVLGPAEPGGDEGPRLRIRLLESGEIVEYAAEHIRTDPDADEDTTAAARRSYKGPMTSLTVSMPPALQSWVDERLAEGLYADAGDYLRDLVRRDKGWRFEDEDEVAEIRALVEEGLASGIIDREPEDVLQEIIDGIPGARD